MKRPSPLPAAPAHALTRPFNSRVDTGCCREPVDSPASLGPGHDFSRLAVYARPAPAGPSLQEPSRDRQRREKEEASWDNPGPHDDKKKVEGLSPTVGLGMVGGVAGAIVGNILGGPLGALVGLVIGAGLGALIGHFFGAGSITWDPPGYSVVAAGGNSTTVERPFAVSYKANRNTSRSVWELEVASIRGGADIEVHTGGSRNPITNPPVSHAEAQAAVTDMKGYYARGQRGAWHTEAASRKHEEHHWREWRCSANHYWPVTRRALHAMTVPLAAHATEPAAITAMRAGPAGADALVQRFQRVTRDYWFTLSDAAASRPYAAGQAVLNEAVGYVQALADSNGWTVDKGRDYPSAEPPCYQPWLPFAP